MVISDHYFNDKLRNYKREFRLNPMFKDNIKLIFSDPSLTEENLRKIFLSI